MGADFFRRAFRFSEVRRIAIGAIKPLTAKVTHADYAQWIIFIEEQFGDVTMHAHLESPRRLTRLDTFPRAGAMAAVVDRHGHRDHTEAAPLENAKIVGIDSGLDTACAQEKGPIPKAKRKKFRMRPQSLAHDLANRRVVMTDHVRQELYHVRETRGQPPFFAMA